MELIFCLQEKFIKSDGLDQSDKWTSAEQWTAVESTAELASRYTPLRCSQSAEEIKTLQGSARICALDLSWPNLSALQPLL